MINNFKPMVWTADLLKELDRAQVFVNLTNRKYEGDIKNAGDQVKILTVNDINIKDYSEYQDITFDKLSGSELILTVDQQKYFAFDVDDVDKIQSKFDLMSETTRKAAIGLSNVSDLAIANTYSEYNNKVSETAFDSSKVFSVLSEIHRKLLEKDIPANESKYLVVSPWVFQKFVLADILKNTNNSSTIKSGMVGNYMGFDIFVSNNVVTSAVANPTSHCIAGTYDAIAFAQQILKMEAGRKEKGFGDYIKGLYVYGYKVLRPNNLVDVELTYAAETTI